MNIKGSKHLTLEQRREILTGILNHQRLVQIATNISKDPRSISREIKLRRQLKTNNRSQFNRMDFIKNNCPRTLRYPFVCDGCDNRRYCLYVNQYYYCPETAHNRYKQHRSATRTGINLTGPEFDYLDRALTQGIHQGQSIHHIVTGDANMPCSSRTIYRYVGHNLTSIKGHEMRRKVILKKRVIHKTPSPIDLSIRINRTYVDFIAFLLKHPGTLIAQMDTILGPKHDGPCLLTIHFITFRFMIAFKLDSHTSEEVSRVFRELQNLFTPDEYRALFSVILTDRGTEFVRPEDIEIHHQTGEIISHVFFTDPQASNQKAQIEENHTLLRYILPKGTRLGFLTDELVATMLSHINSYHRKVIATTPYDLMNIYYGQHILNKLKVRAIRPDLVYLKPSLFSQK